MSAAPVGSGRAPESEEPPTGPPVPGRPPLPAAELRRALITPDSLWTAVEVRDETGSTNADVTTAARAGAPEGLVIAAEHQRAGRGRAGRSWSSPPGAGLWVSVLLRPGPVPATSWGWLPLLAGVALAETVTAEAAVGTALKWPNDLLIAGRKCAGILSEVAGEALVLGIGLNVTTSAAELPPGPATSLALAGSRTTDRSALLISLLRRIAGWYARWRADGGDADGCGLRPAYRRHCGTLGEPVRVLLPDRRELAGTAEDVDRTGRLVLRTGTGVEALAAGEVRHLRPAR